MHQMDKLEEAKYFLHMLEKSAGDYEASIFNLSAFVSATKAALGYVFNEIKDESQEKWLHEFIDSKPEFLFFKNIKDICIHNNPLSTTKKLEVDPPTIEIEYLDEMDDEVMDDYLLKIIFEKLKGGIDLTDSEVRVIERCSFKLKAENWRGKESYYRFNDWTSKEDMIELCTMYIKGIEHFFSLAASKGY